MKDHLPRHLLEKLVADDPHAPVHPALRVHVASCDHCNTRKRALEAARADYLLRNPAAPFAGTVLARVAQPEPTPKGKFRAWKAATIWASASALLVAAAMLVVLRSADVQRPAPERWKGGLSFRVFVQHAGETRILHDGDSLAQGDQLAFTYALEHPRQLLLLGIDADGTITRYFPADDSHAGALAAAARAQLPISIELDMHPGEERLFALFSEHVLDEQRVRGVLTAALNQSRARRAGVIGLGEIDLPAQQVSVWFRKP
jgi:hypothetical protein